MWTWQARLERPNIVALLVVEVQRMAKVSSYLVLDGQVLFELVVIFDDFVSTTLKLVNERTAAFTLMCLTLSISQKVGTVLARSE